MFGFLPYSVDRSASKNTPARVFFERDVSVFNNGRFL